MIVAFPEYLHICIVVLNRISHKAPELEDMRRGLHIA